MTTNGTTPTTRFPNRLTALGLVAVGLTALLVASPDSAPTPAPAATRAAAPTPAPVQPAVYSAQSPTCVEVHGQTATDRDRALAFCARGVSPGTVTGVIAMESLLWLKVTPAIAGAMRVNSVETEQLVKNYLRGWRFHTGRKAVTVYLELGDVELARGETTLLGSDTVTLRH